MSNAFVFVFDICDVVSFLDMKEELRAHRYPRNGCFLLEKNHRHNQATTKPQVTCQSPQNHGSLITPKILGTTGK